jgi:hypothetical protein
MSTLQVKNVELQSGADERNRWTTSGNMNVRISHTLLLSESAEAHRLMESGTVHNGKILVIP